MNDSDLKKNKSPQTMNIEKRLHPGRQQKQRAFFFFHSEGIK